MWRGYEVWPPVENNNIIIINELMCSMFAMIEMPDTICYAMMKVINYEKYDSNFSVFLSMQ